MPYTVALEVGGWEVIKQYVAMGLGISIVTAICLTDADRGAPGRALAGGVLPVAQLRRGGAQGQVPVSPQARAFIELIQPALFERAGYDETGQSER